MKALLRIQRAGVNALPTVKYILTLKGGQKAERDKDIDARVGNIYTSDDLKDVDLSTTEGREEAATKIEGWDTYCKTKHTTKTDKRGKKKRVRCRKREHITISALPGGSHVDFEKRLVKSLPKLTKDLDIKTYVLVFHVDCAHPHAHLVCEAYAPSIGKGARRHISKSQLDDLNKNTWTKEFDAPSVTAPEKSSDRSKRYKAKKIKSWSDDKIELAAKLHHYAPSYKVGDASALVAVDMPELTKDFKKVNGELKKSASVKDGNTTLRLNTYQKMLHVLQEDPVFKEKLKSLRNAYSGDSAQSGGGLGGVVSKKPATPTAKKVAKTAPIKKKKPKPKTKAKGYAFKTPKIGKLLHIAKNVKQGAEDMTRIPGMIARAAIAATPLGKAVNAAEMVVDVAKKVVDEPKPEKPDYTKNIEAFMNSVDPATGLKQWQLVEIAREKKEKKEAVKKKRREALPSSSKKKQIDITSFKL